MRRRHSRADAIAFTNAVRGVRPDVVFGADLIAGFPTETEAAFANSLAIVDDCGLTQLHVFPYSPRPGTPAERMPQLDRQTVKERAARLRSRGESAMSAHLIEESGRTRHVLVERNGFGRTEHYIPTSITGGQPGTIVTAQIVGHNDGCLVAEAA